METQLRQVSRKLIITQEIIASWHIHWHIPNEPPTEKDGKLSHTITARDYKMIVEYKDDIDINCKKLIVNVLDIKTNPDDSTITIVVGPSKQSKANHTMYVAGGKSRDAIYAEYIGNKFFLNFCCITQN